MMDEIRQYVISIILAAIICGLITHIMGNKGINGELIKLVCGVFMAIVFISPLVKLDFSDWDNYWNMIVNEKDMAVMEGHNNTLDEMAAIIKEQSESYILDKAGSLKLDLEVEVTLSDSNPPVPIYVELKGAVSPYAKSQLAQIIETDLGIAEENQEWN